MLVFTPSRASTLPSNMSRLHVLSQHGLTGHAAALRWTVHHSALDYDKGYALIIGASSLE